MDLCPPAHREMLELKRQGIPLAEIAERTGLHESSVRRILYELAKRLAATRRGDRPAVKRPHHEGDGDVHRPARILRRSG